MKKASETFAYPGSGTLSNYNEDGSWLVNQLENGYQKCPKGITVRDENGNIRFSSRETSIARHMANAIFMKPFIAYENSTGDEPEEHVTIISSSWCKNRSGICLSFAVPVDVMDTDQLSEFGDMFVDAVYEPYGKMIKESFIPKTEKPLIASHDGELIMIWSFQADNNQDIIDTLMKNNIQEINYDE